MNILDQLTRKERIVMVALDTQRLDDPSLYCTGAEINRKLPFITRWDIDEILHDLEMLGLVVSRGGVVYTREALDVNGEKIFENARTARRFRLSERGADVALQAVEQSGWLG